MKITAVSYRAMLYGSLILLVLLGVVALFVQEMSVGPVAPVLYFALAAAWVYCTIKGLQNVNQNWVSIDSATVSWRTLTRRGKPAHASETGSVPMASIVGFAVATRERPVGKSVARGHLPVLTLTDGKQITLPIWSTAARTTPQLLATIVAFRAACPETVRVDTSAIEASSTNA